MKDRDTYMLHEAYAQSQKNDKIIREGKVADFIRNKIESKLAGFKDWLEGEGQEILRQKGILQEDFVIGEGAGDIMTVLGGAGVLAGAIAVYLNMDHEVVQSVLEFFPDLYEQIMNLFSGGEAGAEGATGVEGGTELQEPTRPTAADTQHQFPDFTQDMQQAANAATIDAHAGEELASSWAKMSPEDAEKARDTYERYNDGEGKPGFLKYGKPETGWTPPAGWTDPREGGTTTTVDPNRQPIGARWGRRWGG